MEARVDGRSILTLPKPKRSRPLVISAEGLVDGKRVAVAAEYVNPNSVRADVFVEGRSLVTGTSLAVAVERSNEARACAAAEIKRDRPYLILQVPLYLGSLAPVVICVAMLRSSAERGIPRAVASLALFAALFPVLAMGQKALDTVAHDRDGSAHPLLRGVGITVACIVTSIVLAAMAVALYRL